MTRGRRIALLAGAPVLALVVAWLGGFAWFLHVAQRPTQPPPVSDGIVALTGGAGRVETALQLLAEGRAHALLVSGVGRAAEFPELAHRAGVSPALASVVTLGRAALSTHGNAAETALWVHDHHIASLIVVTAGYHMPRALAELRRSLPGVVLHPAPVVPPALRGTPDAATLRLLAGEYMKFLAVTTGLSGMTGHGDEQHDATASRTSIHVGQSPGRMTEQGAG